MKTDQYLIDFYNQYDEDSRLAPRHGSVEFLTTMRYIEKYIRPGHRVLEVGAGTGRYSHALASRSQLPREMPWICPRSRTMRTT